MIQLFSNWKYLSKTTISFKSAYDTAESDLSALLSFLLNFQ